jgi:2-phospho-L-lactate guanylyltransferase
VLSRNERLSLARTLLRNVLKILTKVRGISGVIVVGDTRHLPSGSRLVKLASAARLNAAVTLGVRLAAQRGAQSALIVPADVARLEARELQRRLQRAIESAERLPAAKAAAIASCQRGDGTNLLWLYPAAAIQFRYGPGSFVRHRRLLAQRGFRCRHWARVADIDTPDDLALLECGRDLQQ